MLRHPNLTACLSEEAVECLGGVRRKSPSVRATEESKEFETAASVSRRSEAEGGRHAVQARSGLGWRVAADDSSGTPLRSD